MKSIINRNSQTSSAFFKFSRKFPKNRATQVEIMDREKGGSTSFTVEKIELTRVRPRVFSSETRISTAYTFSTVAYITPYILKYMIIQA